jgi:hypothetical protein
MLLKGRHETWRLELEVEETKAENRLRHKVNCRTQNPFVPIALLKGEQIEPKRI